ncbi:prolipoprotein diacylglyceryl transferase [Marinicrinis lubricantis]|uniref:Phosphatidylglycerol--prolipoprotein diacylglyceryl transferase n=1 Tax=Marinicrinis lubricantis TaxID=2086470 RepID=A0ABW1INA9_9BACL
MKNELFHLGLLTIHAYGLMIAIGVLIAYKVVVYRAEKRKMELSPIYGLIIWGLFGGFVGAKLLYWITQIEAIVEQPKMLLDLSSGFVVYGGMIGGIAAGWLYCKKQRIHFLRHLDLFVPSIALAQGFGRIGCFLAGCCYGEETDHWLGITYHESHFAPHDVKLVPTQLFSSVFNFMLFFILLALARRKRADGFIAGMYLLIYSVGRFIIEFFRGDVIRGSVGALSTSQAIAIPVFLCTCIILIWQVRQFRGSLVKH